MDTEALLGVHAGETRPVGARWGALGVVALFLALSLVAVWGLDFLPMQDYPQHLFQAKLLAQALDGRPLDTPAYQVHLKPTYSVFYLLVYVFQKALLLTSAGKAAVSLYFVLTAAACWRTLGFFPGRRLGWAAMLLFPAAFNPIYFLGFINFLYAMPVLWLILLEVLKRSETGWNGRAVAIYTVSLIVLLFIHPFAVATEGVVVGVWFVATVRSAARRRFFGIAVALCGLVAGGWMLSSVISPAGTVGPSGMAWISPLRNLEFVLDLFTGLRGYLQPDLPTLLLWLAAFVVIGVAAVRGGLELSQRRLVGMIGLAMTVLVAAVLFLPFTSSNVGYLNVRLSMTIYFLLILSASSVRMGRWGATAIGAVAVMLMVRSFVIQKHISDEVAEIRPLISMMQPDAKVLPLLFDRESPEADGYFFSLHLNDHFYYQLARGGGSPYLWDAPLEGKTPVFFRRNAQLPAPDLYDPTQFRWEKFGDPYRYFLVRGGSPSLYRYMERRATLRGASAKWRLYEQVPESRP